MVIEHYINRKTLASSDTKPLPEYLKSVIVHENDTGDTWLSDGTTTTRVKSALNTETLTNKEIDFSTSRYDQALEDNMFSVGAQRKGGLIPAATPQGSAYGILEGGQFHNANLIQSSDNGLLIVFTSEVDSDKLGYSSNVPIARRADGYRIKGEFQNSMNNSMLIGFSTSQYFSAYSNVFFNNDVGVAVGFTPSQTNYSAFVNDGSGTPATPVAFSLPKDRVLHTIEIILEATQIRCLLDNEEIILTTKLPSLTANLYLNVYGVY